MRDQRKTIIENALRLMRETGSRKMFLFLNTIPECRWWLKSGITEREHIILVIPKNLNLNAQGFKCSCSAIIRSWAGNQTRFSRIKYAFLHGVMQGMINTDSKVVCVLGPSGKSHLDTVTIHDLSLSWSEEFPFDVRGIIKNSAFHTIMAVVDIALDIGALGREGKSVGTIFVIGDTENVLKSSHQAVFNAFKGYPRKERMISLAEVVESIKELAKLDGAIIISENGIVEAAGRHLDAGGTSPKKFRGLGARHRAAIGITRRSKAVAIVVSESTGKVTIFEKGNTVSTLEPLISRRLV
ncbi:MAG: DNA integrity scanning protein DisA nucleotide-binding domain protein [Nitrospirae bacterium]|nr:DNA integrity scanning protein DisA nucleotide-binding domain protein [Nitrospirota bacterium]